MTTRRWRPVAMVAATTLIVAAAVAVPSSAQAAVACEVDFAANPWGDDAGGYTAQVTLRSTGTDPIDGWTLEFDLPGGSTLTQGWNADWSQSGATVSATNLEWNGSLGETTIGFNGSGYAGAPETFTINGVTCNDDEPPPPPDPELQASVTSLTVPADGEADFSVSLTDEPPADVAASVSVTGDETITVAPTDVTFPVADWATPHDITVSAAPDSAGDTATVTVSADGFDPVTVDITVGDGPAPPDDEWVGHFLDQYGAIKDPDSGYFSPEWGIPYHAVETLIVEAPEHGHQTTSEAFSYWLWLEANYGRVTGQWEPFVEAWESMERWIIPQADEQPTNASYNPNDPATYAPELDSPGEYPSPLDPGVEVGQDPIGAELAQTYGSSDVYAMHWLLDVDDRHGYGRCGDGEPGPALVNTFQRGPQESVWQTIVHPSCERFNWGGPNGFLDLFIGDEQYAQQWRYTAAPDADARAVQVAYWAHRWASEQGQGAVIADTISKAAKMGDWARYSFFDKYFKEVGNCVGPTTCPGATGKDSAHYLIQWYFSWGGGLTADWAFRIGAGHTHQGYQNPMAAWALAGNVPELTPESPTGADDWAASLDRQLEFYQWLQAGHPDGGGLIAGGATNSWRGRYAEPPAGTPTFHGMFYDEKPVWHDPNSNLWFGFQVWSLQRVAEYLYVTGDERARDVLDAWVARAIAETTVNADGSWSVPADLRWSGEPETWDPDNPAANAGLQVEVATVGQDVGVTAGLARTLLYYSAATGDQASHDLALDLLDALVAHFDGVGVAVPETRADYNRFDDAWDDSGIPILGTYIPEGWSGEMPNGDVIEPGATFIDLRSYLRDDPEWPKVQAYLDGGPAPEFTYHRFWAQAEVANAYADYAFLFGEG